jgi:phage protein D
MPDVIRADFVVPADRPAPAPAEQPAAPAQGIGNVDRLVPDVLIKVNGAPLSKKLREAMHTVEVHQSLKVADMAVLTFDNPGNIVSDANEVNCGNEVEVELGYLGGRTALFKGEIISLEPNWPVNQSPSCVVRAYDKMHAMRRGRKQRTFTEQKVSDIVSSIASEEGLTPEVEDTAVVAKYILQNNQSNVEILRELARRYQCEIKVDGVNKKLILRKPKSDQGEGKTLAWGKDLKSFYVKMSVANVASKVEVKTWDVAQKQTVVSTVETQHGSLDVSPSILDLAKKFGEAKKQITNRPTSDPGEAKAMAASALNEGAMDGVTARATCMGDTELAAGEVVKLDGLGKSWTGKYYITASTHLYHRASGYSTEIELGRNGIGSTPVTQVVDPPTPEPTGEDREDPGSLSAGARHTNESFSDTSGGGPMPDPGPEQQASEEPAEEPAEQEAEEAPPAAPPPASPPPDSASTAEEEVGVDPNPIPEVDDHTDVHD